MPVSETLSFLRAQKAVEVFPDGEHIEYDLEKLGLISYASWRYEGYKRTLDMLLKSFDGRQKPKVLELGALPYIFSGLLLRLADKKLELYLAGAPSRNPNRIQGKVIIENNFLLRKTCSLPLALFNVEEDMFPYPDEMFDVVLCCEILEHLPFSPSHMLYEINRVLKSKGKLILTTPNVLGIGKILALLRGRNIYAPLSRISIYGRHNREYTPKEVQELLHLSNFKIIEIFYASPTYPREAYSKGPFGLIKYHIIYLVYKLIRTKFLRHRGDFLLFRAQKIGPPTAAEPEFLYGEVADTRHN